MRYLIYVSGLGIKLRRRFYAAAADKIPHCHFMGINSSFFHRLNGGGGPLPLLSESVNSGLRKTGKICFCALLLAGFMTQI